MEQVEDGFNLVLQEVGDILLRLNSDNEVSEKVEQFGCYFQKTYIRGISRAPLLEPAIWNQNNGAAEGLAGTNIAFEGWQYGIQLLFGATHPDVWILLQKFGQDAPLNKFNALQAVTVTKRNRAENINSWMPDFKVSLLLVTKTMKISFLSERASLISSDWLTRFVIQVIII